MICGKRNSVDRSKAPNQLTLKWRDYPCGPNLITGTLTKQVFSLIGAEGEVRLIKE